MEYSEFWKHCVPASVVAELPHCSEGHPEPEALCDAILKYGCPVCRGFVVLIALGCSGPEAVKLLQLKAKLG
jgi:hypothetical protein